jgi:hypothetical protein
MVIHIINQFHCRKCGYSALIINRGNNVSKIEGYDHHTIDIDDDGILAKKVGALNMLDILNIEYTIEYQSVCYKCSER